MLSMKIDVTIQILMILRAWLIINMKNKSNICPLKFLLSLAIKHPICSFSPSNISMMNDPQSSKNMIITKAPHWITQSCKYQIKTERRRTA
jgi:hypothetical protein